MEFRQPGRSSYLIYWTPTKKYFFEKISTGTLVDAEKDASIWKRLANKAPKFDSALVDELRAKLKHSEELFEKERKLKEQAAQELRKTQEELKNVNDQLDAARTSAASVKSLLSSKMKAAIEAITEAATGALSDVADTIDCILPGATKGSMTDGLSGALSQALPGQIPQGSQSQPSTDIVFKSLEVGKSPATVSRGTESTSIDPPSASSFPMPTRQQTLPSRSSSPLQGRESLQIPTRTAPRLPAPETQVKTTSSTPQAEPSAEKLKVSAATVLKAPIQKKLRNLEEEFGFHLVNRPPGVKLELSKVWPEEPDNSIPWDPESESDEKGTKRRGSSLQSPGKWQRRE